MPGNHSLPPDLEQLVQKQLHTGRFRDETEVFSTALHLLEERSRSSPVSIEEFFGMWKGRDEDGLAYQRRLRSEWSK